MAVYAGRLVLIKVDTSQVGGGSAVWVTIGQQRGGSFGRSMETADATHKDDAGWASAVITRRAWSISADGALDPANPGWVEILEMFDANTVTWIQVDASAIASGEKKEGTAIITDLSYEFPESDLVSFTIELQGDGALVTSP